MLNVYAGHNRFVWNYFLRLNLRRLAHGHKLLWYGEMANYLSFLKKTDELSFLREAPSQTLQQTLRNLDRAFRDAFDPTQPLKRLPRFKKRGERDGFRFPQGFKLEGSRIFLPKMGWVRYFKSRDVEGTSRNVSVTREPTGWFISVQTERKAERPRHTSSSVVGVDVGVASFATLSDGTTIAPLNSFRRSERALARAQRRLARKKKFSANWKKEKLKVGRLHHRIANMRKDFLHKISTTISKNHAVVVVEDLKVRNMSKSARGDAENPGRNVRAKAGLNKSILDQGWYMFRQMLDYKLEALGGKLIAVDPRYTSQTCPECGHRHEDNRLSQAVFSCLSCAHTDHADIVGAKNILRRGIAVNACGGAAQAGPMKQEPADSRELPHPLATCA